MMTTTYMRKDTTSSPSRANVHALRLFAAPTTGMPARLARPGPQSRSEMPVERGEAWCRDSCEPVVGRMEMVGPPEVGGDGAVLW